MREWYSTFELADLKLPGLSHCERTVRRQAARENWPSRPRSGRGGGREYPFSALPVEAQAAILRGLKTQALVAGLEAMLPEKPFVPAAPETVEAQPMHVPRPKGSGATRLDARIEVVRVFRQWLKDCPSGLSRWQAEARFCEVWRRGEIDVCPDARAALPDFSVSTLHRILDKAQLRGADGLVDRYGNRRGAGVIDSNPAISGFVIAVMVDRPSASAAVIHELIRRKFENMAIPAQRSLQRWMEKWKQENAETFLAMRNPDAWRSQRMVAFGSQSETVKALNQRWEMDSTPADLMLADGRYSLVGGIDVWSRTATLLVTRTSTASAVASCLRRMMLTHGVPDVLKMDNGSDYASKHIKRVCTNLGIEQDFCKPFTPQQKPHIERFFRSFSHHFLELLPGYIGHSVAERKEIESRKSFAERLMGGDKLVELPITAAQLQGFCDWWIREIYDTRPHEGLNRETPQALRQRHAHLVRPVKDVRALDLLLAEAPDGDGIRTVGKKGIRVAGSHYISGELGLHIGKIVQVRLDPADYGRIYVFDEDMVFLCMAENPETTGISRAAVTETAKALQRRNIADAKKRVRSLRDRVNPRDALRLLTGGGMNAADSSYLLADGPVLLPRRSREDVPLSEREAEHLRQIEADLAEMADVVRLPTKDSPRDRFARALEIQVRLEMGQSISAEDQRWFNVYRNQPEFTSRTKFAEDFGVEAALEA
jgi:putative transposase